MKKLTEARVREKVVLIRVDFNVPMDSNGNIVEDSRIKAALPTIKYLLENEAAVVLMSHFGRPKNGADPKYSLRPLQNYLADLLGTFVYFVDNCIGEKAEHICRNLVPGDVVLLENLRFHPEEEKGDPAFASQLADLCDIYVNDAFGTAHRPHASTAVICQFKKEKYAGFLLASEVENASKILKNFQKPFVAVIGGAKVADKIGIIDQLLNQVDTLIIGGGMAFTFIKAQGGEIGNSLVELDKVPLAQQFIKKAATNGVQLILPIDVIAADKVASGAKCQTILATQIPNGLMGLDIGPQTIQAAAQALKGSKTILWNGPMGVFEIPEFANGTYRILDIIARATQEGAYSLAGGGDSLSALENAGKKDAVSYVSTGGGALLEFIEKGTLPGIDALN